MAVMFLDIIYEQYTEIFLTLSLMEMFMYMYDYTYANQKHRFCLFFFGISTKNTDGNVAQN